jgi:restriction endonuclease Mrr
VARADRSQGAGWLRHREGDVQKVVEDEAFTEEQQALSTKDGRMSEIEYRLHWAQTHLKGIGAIMNSARGVWTITEKGETITSEQVQADTKAWRAQGPHTQRLDNSASPQLVRQVVHRSLRSVLTRLLKGSHPGLQGLNLVAQLVQDVVVRGHEVTFLLPSALRGPNRP